MKAIDRLLSVLAAVATVGILLSLLYWLGKLLYVLLGGLYG